MSVATITADKASTDLSTLANKINHAHADTLTAARTTLEHARRVGDLLIEAKAAVPHGEWLPWMKENVTFSVATAGRYVKVAANWDQVNLSSVTNLTEATALLTEPNAKKNGKKKRRRSRYEELHVDPIDADEPSRTDAPAATATNNVDACPNCGSTERTEDGDCSKCFEPLGEQDDVVDDSTDDVAVNDTIEPADTIKGTTQNNIKSTKRNEPEPWTIGDVIRALTVQSRRIFDRCPVADRETMAHKLIGLGQEILENGDLGA